MPQIGGAAAVVLIQVGYCISDIVSKCGVGLVIYQIKKSLPDAQIGGAAAVVLIQIGYCISDIVSKFGVCLVIFPISRSEGLQRLC